MNKPIYRTYTFATDTTDAPVSIDFFGEVTHLTYLGASSISLWMDIDDNIDFTKPVIGCGFDTEDIKDYVTLLAFLVDHYDEIREDETISGYNRHAEIDELISICEEKIKLNESH